MLNILRWLSWVITLVGIAILVAALALDLQPVYTLTGILLLWTGIVKVIVMRLWTVVVGLGTERHDPVPPD